MIPTIIIGDLHADLAAYRSAIRQHGSRLPSIQVGDFGIGHFSERELAEVQHLHQGHPGRRFIRGNHDHPAEVRVALGWIPDGTISGRVLFLGGADPGDATQLPAVQAEHLLTELAALAEKPSVVISHDAPQAVAEQVFRHTSIRGSGTAAPRRGIGPSRTRTFLAEVQNIVQPELWIFGHWHEAWQGQDGATTFRCMGFQESFILPLPWDPARRGGHRI